MQFLQNSRWSPYLLGVLIGLLMAMGMFYVWKYWRPLAFAWLGLFMVFGPFLPRKGVPAKVITTAMFVGTFAPLMFQ